jgi:hypothetical protein
MNTRRTHEYSRIGLLITSTIGAALPVSCDANTQGSLAASTTSSQVQNRTASQVTPHRDVSPAPGLVGVLPVTDRILMLHMLDASRKFPST